MKETLSFLGISGSLRRQSRNTGLLRAAKVLAPANVAFELADLTQVPFYNADIADGEKPPAIQKIFTQLAKADALVLACPEYNYSLAPALKNILDWASREPENALLAGKPVVIMGAAGGMGSSRSQYHLRQVCVYLDLHPLNKPEIFSNAFSASFNEAGDLVDEALLPLLGQAMTALAAWTHRLAGEAANG